MPPQPGIYPFDLAGATEQHYHELSEIIHEKYTVLDGLLHNAAVLDALSPVETLVNLFHSRNVLIQQDHGGALVGAGSGGNTAEFPGRAGD